MRSVRALTDWRDVAAAATAVEQVVPGALISGEAVQVAAVAQAAAPATQVRRPWRTTLRTTLQAALALGLLLPAVVDALGLDRGLPLVAGALALAAGATRVMALPAVEAFLQQFAPWLAARPPAPPDGDHPLA